MSVSRDKQLLLYQNSILSHRASTQMQILVLSKKGRHIQFLYDYSQGLTMDIFDTEQQQTAE